MYPIPVPPMYRLLPPASLAILSVALCTGPTSAQGRVPTPVEVLGHEVGADFFLATYDQSLDYFRKMDAASDKLQLLEVGRSSFGAPWHIALISSPENLADLNIYRDIAMRLAHPGGLSDEAAREMAQQGKAIVHIDGGLHSSESATGQFPMQLAYNLITDDSDPEVAAILDEVILMLWFSINPDGQNMLSNWYMSNVGTPYELSGVPWLYQKYVGHDNNRDGYMLNTLESRVVTRVLREWEPQIVYNHHQSSPFPTRIWIPPFAEPISTDVHPLMWRTVNLIGMGMSYALEERGMPGATHMGSGFDDWYPGFIDHANNFHNVVSLLTETALFSYATPRFYGLNDFPANQRELRPGSLYSSPWRGGWWRIKDAVNYMEVASLAVLNHAAKFKDHLLYNRYQAGRDTIAEHEAEPPYAYIIPQDQRDPVASVELLRRMAFNGIDVQELIRETEYSGLYYPAGTWVIPMAQPFARFVRQLFQVQNYPDLRTSPDGPPDNPYDVAGWTLPLQMDLSVVEATEPLPEVFRSAMRPVRGRAVSWDAADTAGSLFDSPVGVGFDTNATAAGIVPPPGTITGEGDGYFLDPGQNNTFKALDLAYKAEAKVQIRPAAEGQAGGYVVSGVDETAAQGWVDALHLRVERTSTEDLAELPRPRVGLFRPWAPSMDEGWTRWVLERYGIDPISLYNADIRAGRLDERIDILVLASIRGGTIMNGRAKGTVHGRYAGGIGKGGLAAIDDFIRAGGTLVCIGGSTGFAISEFHLPVENVTQGLSSREYSASGSIHRVTADTKHPVMWGTPETAKIFMDRSPVFTTKEGFEGVAFAKYEKNGSPLLSGYLLGEDHIKGFAPALDVPHGDGHILLIGFPPQWRAQPFGSFRVLLNACLYHDSMAAVGGTGEDFWKAPEEKEEDGAEETPATGQRRGGGRRGGRRGGRK